MDLSSLLPQGVPTTVQQANQQALQQQAEAQNQAIRQAMAPGALQQQQLAVQSAQQQLQNSRRAMATSMYASVGNIADPDQQQQVMQKIGPLIEKHDPTLLLPKDADGNYVYDPTASKVLAMSQIPVAQQPEYLMNQQNIALMQALKNRLAPDAPAAAASPPGIPAPATAAPGGPPPAPAPLSASDMALMALVRPQMADALVKQGELALKQNPGPQKEAEKTAENAAEVGKTFNVMTANLPVVLQRFKEMNDAAGDASYGLGVKEEGDGTKQLFHQQFDALTGRPEAKANTILQQRAAQGILPELGPQLAQAGIRGNKFLETIASSASGLDLAANPEAKQAAINGLRSQYINNLKSTARQVRAYGGTAPTDDEIDAAVAKYEANPPTTGTPAPPMTAVQQAQAVLKPAAKPNAGKNVAPDGTIAHDGKGNVLIKRGGQWVKP